MHGACKGVLFPSRWRYMTPYHCYCHYYNNYNYHYSTIILIIMMTITMLVMARTWKDMVVLSMKE